MKSYSVEFKVRTRAAIDFVNITDKILQAVSKSGVRDGLINVFIPHTTVGIFINEDESGLRKDVERTLLKLIPERANYAHDEVDYNAHAHLKSIILSPSTTIPINDGKLMIGTWQSIFLAEFDGPRERRVLVKVIGAD
ncbi:MAG: YjbQ family protein [Thaumarchaeota archaeon]|nr:YjbQ family protein [Nitrososphaerota archaeon]